MRHGKISWLDDNKAEKELEKKRWKLNFLGIAIIIMIIILHYT